MFFNVGEQKVLKKRKVFLTPFTHAKEIIIIILAKLTSPQSSHKRKPVNRVGVLYYYYRNTRVNIKTIQYELVQTTITNMWLSALYSKKRNII